MTPRSSSLAADAQEGRAWIRRGAISFAGDPPEFWYGAVPVQLSPLEAELMALVMRRRRVPWAAVNEVLRNSASGAAVRDVLVYRIRRKFRAAGAQNPLETIRGWGLRLSSTVQGDAPGHLLIGARVIPF